MSYDLTAFHLPPGRTIEEHLETLGEDPDGDRPLAGEERAALEPLVAAVLALEPGAERFDAPDHVELTAGDIGLQVSLFRDEAGASVPYWHDGREAEAAMARLFAVGAALRDTGGFTVFDPQTDEVLDGGADPGRAPYRVGRDVVREVERTERPRRRWWQRGRGREG